MWLRMGLSHNLRILIRVLSRVRLRPETFTSYIEYRNSKEKTKNMVTIMAQRVKTIKTQSTNPNKHAIANELFRKLIASNNPKDNAPRTIPVSNTDPKDIEDFDFDDDNDEDEDEQEHTNVPVKNDDNKEYTSKTVRSLVATVATLVKSSDTDCKVVQELVCSSNAIADHELVAAAEIINLTWQMSHKAVDVVALPFSTRALYDMFSSYYTIYNETPITLVAEAGKKSKGNDR
ncbi:hypothetical protein BDC45DRAFT_537090 [Circinella umbellata]|nr:hypothetical protein BDC45DRAFT_537090 [Circinella umbellata]